MDNPFEPPHKKSRSSRWSQDSRELPLIPENQLHFTRDPTEPGAPTSKPGPSEIRQYLPELTDPYVASHLRTTSMASHVRHRREHSAMSELYMQEPPPDPLLREGLKHRLFETKTLPDRAVHPSMTAPEAGPSKRKDYPSNSPSDNTRASDSPTGDTPVLLPCPERPVPMTIGEPGPLIARSDPQWVISGKLKSQRYSPTFSMAPFSAEAGEAPSSVPGYYDPAAPKGYSQYDDSRSMDIPGDEYSQEAVYKAWSTADIQELRRQVELAEKFKWKYISDRLSSMENRRIPGVACHRKFKEMFGVAEAETKLKSSLFYVAYRSGWPTIRDTTTEIDLRLDAERQVSAPIEEP